MARESGDNKGAKMELIISELRGEPELKKKGIIETRNQEGVYKGSI